MSRYMGGDQWKAVLYRVALVTVLVTWLTSCVTPPPARVVGGKYRLITTNQQDLFKESAEPMSAADVLAAGGAAGDVFTGKDRRAAKTSLSTAAIQSYNSVSELRASLESDADMVNLAPPISKDPGSDRREQEQRNVSVRAYLYAIKKESDRDFHVIVGDESCQNAQCFLNVEVSGWPKNPQDPDRPALKSVRATFIEFFGGEDPGTGSGYDTPDPPIPVLVTGSLFFDIDHSAGTVGPSCCRPNTAWEIHPVRTIDFEPAPP